MSWKMIMITFLELEFFFITASLSPMDSGTIETAQTSMCNEIYRVFSSLVAELMDLCVKSQMSLDEYKQSLPNLAIPNTVLL